MKLNGNIHCATLISEAVFFDIMSGHLICTHKITKGVVEVCIAPDI